MRERYGNLPSPHIVRESVRQLHDHFTTHGHSETMWEGVTPDVRERYAQALDDLVTDMRGCRAAFMARDWRTCEGCGARFVGVASQRYHSPACKQRAYRQRQNVQRQNVTTRAGK